MESTNVIRFFWISTLVLWLFLLITTFLMSSAGLLRKRGYSDEYISFMTRDYLLRAIMMALLIPVVQVAAYFVTKVFVDDVSSNLEIVALVFILMIIPFPVIDNILTAKKLKSIKENSSGIMVVDFKHKVLHLIYNPFIELTLTIITITYALLVIKPVILFYLHIILPWIFYLIARKSQKTIRPHLKDGYLWAFVFISLNFALIIYYIINSLLKAQSDINSLKFTSGIMLVVILITRIIYYLLNYPHLRQKLQSNY